jgi:hypothetical protein
LVRTVTVPAIATLVGRGNWWPSKPQVHNSGTRTTREHLAKIRKGLRLNSFKLRRRKTAPGRDAAELASDDDQTTTREPEPSGLVGRSPLETDDSRPSESKVTLVDIGRSPTGRRFRR